VTTRRAELLALGGRAHARLAADVSGDPHPPRQEGRELARLEVRYREVHVIFGDSRCNAEEWIYRFLTTALADTADPNPNP